MLMVRVVVAVMMVAAVMHPGLAVVMMVMAGERRSAENKYTYDEW
jgi:hypothetical protein